MLRIMVRIILVVLLQAPLVLAQESLDLQQALRLAKENNLQLQQQKKSEQIAMLEESVQKTNRLPSLDFSLSSSYLSKVNEIEITDAVPIPITGSGRIRLGGHDHSELILSLRQPLFTGFRLQSQVKLAENATLSEQTKFDILSDEIYRQVQLIFYQAQSLYNQRRALQASLERLQIQLQNVRNLFEAAQVMAFDTLQVYNQTLSINIELENNRLATRLVNLQMARILNLSEVRPIADAELERPPTDTLDLSQLKQEALANRSELESIRLAQNAAEIQQKLFRSNYYPSVFAQGGYHYAKPGLNPVANKWMDYFSAAVNLQWNLWRWKGDRNKVEEFQVKHNQLTLQEQELVQTVEFEVEESFENMQFSRKQLGLAEELQAQQAERYRILLVQQRNGVASTNDLITAETDLTRAELQTKHALIQYYVNLVNLKKALGTIGE